MSEDRHEEWRIVEDEHVVWRQETAEQVARDVLHGFQASGSHPRASLERRWVVFSEWQAA